MKRFLLLVCVLFMGLTAYSQNSVWIKNSTGTDMRITFGASQTACAIDLSATYVVPAWSSMTLQTPTMTWSGVGYDPTIVTPMNWHTVRIFEWCNPSASNPGYINYNGSCLGMPALQVIPFTPTACVGNATANIGHDFKGDFWIELY